MSRGRVGLRAGFTCAIAVVAVLVVSSGGCGPETATTPAPDAASSESAEVATAKALELMDREQYTEAVSALQRFGPDPTPRIAKLRDEALSEAEAFRKIRRACLETNGRDLEAVYRQCSKIQAGSRYHDSGCCAGAAERFGEQALSEAVEALDGEQPERGLARLETLVSDSGLPAEIRDRARSIRERAQGLTSSSGASGQRPEQEPAKGVLSPSSPPSLSPWLDEETEKQPRRLNPWLGSPRTKREKAQQPLRVWMD